MIHKDNCYSVTWKPVFAGALAGTGLSFLLNLFGAAIGLTAFTTSQEGLETLAFGGLAGTAIAIIVSMFVTGWVSGHLAREVCSSRCMGALHGFLAWTVALLIAIFCAGFIQRYIYFYAHVISGAGDTFIQASNTVSTASLRMKMGAHAEGLVVSAWIMFVLFFLGAFAASLGGYCGMLHKPKK